MGPCASAPDVPALFAVHFVALHRTLASFSAYVSSPLQLLTPNASILQPIRRYDLG